MKVSVDGCPNVENHHLMTSYPGGYDQCLMCGYHPPVEKHNGPFSVRADLKSIADEVEHLKRRLNAIEAAGTSFSEEIKIRKDTADSIIREVELLLAYRLHPSILAEVIDHLKGKKEMGE